MPGHHVRRGGVVEVGHVHIVLVVEQGQVNHVAVMSPRTKFYVALLLILSRYIFMLIKVIQTTKMLIFFSKSAHFYLSKNGTFSTQMKVLRPCLPKKKIDHVGVIRFRKLMSEHFKSGFWLNDGIKKFLSKQK